MKLGPVALFQVDRLCFPSLVLEDPVDITNKKFMLFKGIW